MKLHELKPTQNSKHRRKRVGRGDSSGLGKTCGRGEKGQMSRSGAAHRPYFEGGQIPLFRRLPKRGFKNANHKFYNVVNLTIIEKLFAENDVVEPDTLRQKGAIGKNNLELKILGNGDITKAVTVKANKFSDAAKSKIEAAGGKCELIN